ncbi:hypothetical protein CDAR_522091, partial [Caerostris darwini]
AVPRARRRSVGQLPSAKDRASGRRVRQTVSGTPENYHRKIRGRVCRGLDAEVVVSFPHATCPVIRSACS